MHVADHPFHRLSHLALLWVGLAVLAQAATPSPPRLRIEYVQSILREDQPLAVCTRVEAARAEGARIAVAVRDGDGQVLAAVLNVTVQTVLPESVQVTIIRQPTPTPTRSPTPTASARISSTPTVVGASTPTPTATTSP